MNPNNTKNVPSVKPQPVIIQFKFVDVTAINVSVAGTFNDWNPETKPLFPLGCGHWSKEIELLPGTYEYCFVVDGRWVPDPLARETVANAFGGKHSVLHVAQSAMAGHLADAEKLPMISTNN